MTTFVGSITVDDGHKHRIKKLAKDMIKGVELLDVIERRAYALYIEKHPLPEWANRDRIIRNAPLTGEQLVQISDQK